MPRRTRNLEHDSQPTMEFRVVELALHLPQPLLETLARMAQYRHCSVEALVVRLVADNAVVQRYFTRAALESWSDEQEGGWRDDQGREHE